MSFSMRKYVIKKESIFCKNPLKFKLLLGTVVFREKKKKETRCLSKTYNFEFYFMLLSRRMEAEGF